MCLFKMPSLPIAQPLPPAPPPPLPPQAPTPPPEAMEPTDVNPQVKRAKDDRGNKNKNQYSEGTGSLRIKLTDSKKPKVGNAEGAPSSGGLN